jgi:hypothetical protein
LSVLTAPSSIRYFQCAGLTTVNILCVASKPVRPKLYSKRIP